MSVVIVSPSVNVFEVHCAGLIETFTNRAAAWHWAQYLRRITA